MALFEVQHIGVQFRRNGKPFAPFSDVGFALEPGCLYNLTGPSGSGKSTLLNACALMVPRSGGTLALGGVPVERFKPTEWRRRVCLVPQAAALVPGTVRDNLLFPWTLKVNAGTPKPDDDVLRALLSLAMLDDVTLDHAAAVAIDRLFASMDSRANEIYAMVALGATPREAAFPSIKAAVGAGMTPLLAQLSAAGIVQIPGMMSGQILAGADPLIAAKYQIVVLLMISAATTLSIVIICFLSYKKRFSAEGYFLSPALRDDKEGAA